MKNASRYALRTINIKVEMPDPATLYASTDINSLAAPFVPGPALYVEPTLNQQVFIITVINHSELVVDRFEYWWSYHLDKKMNVFKTCLLLNEDDKAV